MDFHFYWSQSRDPYDWLLAFVGIAGIAVALWTLKKIERQTKATEESVEVATNSQRSWIVARGAEIPKLIGLQEIHVRCHFEVFGASPVKICKAKYCFKLAATRKSVQTDGTEADLPDEPQFESETTTLESPDIGSVKPPGEKFDVVYRFQELEAGDSEAVKQGKKALCLYGFIQYRDAFAKAKIRETRFCYICGDKDFLDIREAIFVAGGPDSYNEVE